MNNKTVAANLSKIRKDKKMKAMEISKKLGISESNYCRYESGKNAITVDFINKAAGILGVDVAVILGINKSVSKKSPGNLNRNKRANQFNNKTYEETLQPLHQKLDIHKLLLLQIVNILKQKSINLSKHPFSLTVMPFHFIMQMIAFNYSIT